MINYVLESILINLGRFLTSENSYADSKKKEDGAEGLGTHGGCHVVPLCLPPSLTLRLVALQLLAATLSHTWETRGSGGGG